MAPLEMGEFTLVVGATCAYMVMWYSFLFQQSTMRSASASRAQKQGVDFSRFDYRWAEWDMGDRTVLNTQEQMVPFLLLMWLYAVFCNPTAAGITGFAYVAFRFMYPVVWSITGNATRIAISTLPGYAVVGWYLCALLYVAVTGNQLEPSSAWVWILAIFAALVAKLIVAWLIVGGALGQLNLCLLRRHVVSSSDGWTPLSTTAVAEVDP